LAAGSRLVIINAEPTPYDPVADAVLRDPIGQVLPRLVAAAGGQEPEPGSEPGRTRPVS
jgi:NAD-dependent deacetylase